MYQPTLVKDGVEGLERRGVAQVPALGWIFLKVPGIENLARGPSFSLLRDPSVLYQKTAVSVGHKSVDLLFVVSSRAVMGQLRFSASEKSDEHPKGLEHHEAQRLAVAAMIPL